MVFVFREVSYLTSFHVLQTNADEDHVTILDKWPRLFTSPGEITAETNTPNFILFLLSQNPIMPKE